MQRQALARCDRVWAREVEQRTITRRELGRIDIAAIFGVQKQEEARVARAGARLKWKRNLMRWDGQPDAWERALMWRKRKEDKKLERIQEGILLVYLMLVLRRETDPGPRKGWVRDVGLLAGLQPGCPGLGGEVPVPDVLQKALLTTHPDGLRSRWHRHWVRRVYREWLSEAWEVIIVDIDRSLLHQFRGDGTLDAKHWRQEGEPMEFKLDDALSTK